MRVTGQHEAVRCRLGRKHGGRASQTTLRSGNSKSNCHNIIWTYHFQRGGMGGYRPTARFVNQTHRLRRLLCSRYVRFDRPYVHVGFNNQLQDMSVPVPIQPEAPLSLKAPSDPARSFQPSLRTYGFPGQSLIRISTLHMVLQRMDMEQGPTIRLHPDKRLHIRPCRWLRHFCRHGRPP